MHIQLQLCPAVCADLRSCCAEASCTWHVSCTPYMHVGGTGLSSLALESPWHHVLHGASSQKHSCRCGRSGGGEIWPSVLLHVHSSMHLASSTCVRLDERALTVLLHAWQPVHTSSERACSTNAAPTACVHKQLNATRVHAHIFLLWFHETSLTANSSSFLARLPHWVLGGRRGAFLWAQRLVLSAEGREGTPVNSAVLCCVPNLQEFPEAYFYHVTEEFADQLHDMDYYVNCCGTETTLQVGLGFKQQKEPAHQRVLRTDLWQRTRLAGACVRACV